MQVKSILMYGEIDGCQFEVPAYLYVIHHGSLPLATYVTFLPGGSLHGQTRLSRLARLIPNDRSELRMLAQRDIDVDDDVICHRVRVADDFLYVRNESARKCCEERRKYFRLLEIINAINFPRMLIVCEKNWWSYIDCNLNFGSVNKLIPKQNYINLSCRAKCFCISCIFISDGLWIWLKRKNILTQINIQ